LVVKRNKEERMSRERVKKGKYVKNIVDTMYKRNKEEINIMI